MSALGLLRFSVFSLCSCKLGLESGVVPGAVPSRSYAGVLVLGPVPRLLSPESSPLIAYNGLIISVLLHFGRF